MTSKQRLFLVTARPQGGEGNVVALRTAPGASVPPRETSWRDLVRRLQKKLAKR